MKSFTLENYRRRANWDAMPAAEKKILASIEDELASAEEEGEETFELVDVVDEKGTKVYLFALWPFGSGVLVALKKNSVVADVVQHHFDARGDGALRTALAAAWERQREALGIREMVSFTGALGEPRPKKSAKKDPVLPRIEAMRASIRSGSAADQKALWALVCEAIDFGEKRPIPLRRPFEIDETTRAALELIHEGYDASVSDLVLVGLPTANARAARTDPTKDPGDLARFLGHAPHGPLDAPVRLDGREHPAWALIGDALHDVRPNAEVVAALGTLSSDVRSAILRTLMMPLQSARFGALGPPPKGAQPGSPNAEGAHMERVMGFLLDFGESLGDDAVGIAKEILAIRADWLDRWLPQLTKSPMMGVPHWREQTIALGILARAARRTGAWLDPTHDALLAGLARYHAATYPLAIVLAELPRERAEKIARADLGLIERFPSTESTEAAIERLEASGGGPYMTALFKRVITAIGAGGAPALEAAIARESPQKKGLAQALALVSKAAKKRR